MDYQPLHRLMLRSSGCIVLQISANQYPGIRDVCYGEGWSEHIGHSAPVGRRIQLDNKSIITDGPHTPRDPGQVADASD